MRLGVVRGLADPAVAEAKLAKLVNVKEQFEVVVEADTQVELGSICTISLETEGPWPAGISRTVRVRGFARDVLEGVMSLLLETEP